jgi:hypothetical protein
VSPLAYVLGGPHGGDATERDEVPLGDVVGVLSFVDAPAAELDAQALAATEDVGVEGTNWRRSWKAVAVVGGASVVGWGAHRQDAVEALRGRLGEGATA